MASFNQVVLLGRLTRDPELKTLPGGGTVVKFGLAMNRYFKDAQGETKEETDFVDCELWGDRAKTFANGHKKGSQAFVDGSLRYESWDDKEGGKRSRLIVKANNFQFVTPKENAGAEEEAPPAKPAGNKFQNNKKTNIPF
jgi:single-strand DNA-binding protein